MRSKEDAHDYRYFPEPDLVPLVISDEWLARVKSTLPEMPTSRKNRFVSEFGLREYDASVLTQDRILADYFEQAAASSGDPKAAANWVIGDLTALLKAQNRTIEDPPVPAPALGELVGLVSRGELTGKLAKDVLERMAATGDSARAIVEREGLKAISDTGALEAIAEKVIAENPKQVEQYRGGKTTVLQFFVGQVMKATRGQADPAVAKEVVERKLAG
jgi:aspartyl-tRNA(Asn)/glutamyl-tRNA(Gln) amidotransferase subunit B